MSAKGLHCGPLSLETSEVIGFGFMSTQDLNCPLDSRVVVERAIDGREAAASDAFNDGEPGDRWFGHAAP